MFRVLILGKGTIGRSLSSSLLETGHHVTVISLRQSLKSISLPFREWDIVVDCLDPSSDSIDNYSAVLGYVYQLRKYIHVNAIIKKYCYLSSANLYTPSKDLITESSPSYSPTDLKYGTYLYNKLISESQLSDVYRSKLVILRLVTIIFPCYDSSHNSFFADLSRARERGVRLNLYPGDDLIISFMHLKQATDLIIKTIMQSPNLYPVYNIHSHKWSSRRHLKGYSCNAADCKPLKGRRVTSYYQ